MSRHVEAAVLPSGYVLLQLGAGSPTTQVIAIAPEDAPRVLVELARVLGVAVGNVELEPRCGDCNGILPRHSPWCASQPGGAVLSLREG